VSEIEIGTGPTRITASVHGEGGTVVALGPGAGGNRKMPALVAMAEGIAGSGRRALLFNFPYRERQRRIPDPPAILEATIAAVARAAREDLKATHLVLGGRSMGGRIASQAVAKGVAADALVLLAYPLHPPGKPEVLRDKHLKDVPCPMLFVQGTKDAFARPDLLAAALAPLGTRATLFPIPNGDHSFKVPRNEAPGVPGRILEEVLGFLARLGL
jgi:predicted alpha/beta-hydrolase family hydrolase